MKKSLKLILLGLMTWVVPFIAGFLFFDKAGQLAIDMYLFKSIMIVVGALIGSLAIVIYFKQVKNQFLKEGVISGLIWFITNIVLDILILVPMSGMSMNDYIKQIGIRYLLIPIMCTLSGYLLNRNYS
jgi:hypothetical protein